MSTHTRSSTAFVAFGSNKGDSRSLVEQALRALARIDGVRVARVSPLYLTAPVGGPRQSPFFNGVAELVVRGEPAALLNALLGIEKRLGRRRATRWGPRTIDLDLLLFGRSIVKSRALTLPHPRYHRRRFVLAPLCDLAPRRRHPTLQQEHRTLLARLPVGAQRVTMLGTWKKSRFRLFSKKRKPANASLR